MEYKCPKCNAVLKNLKDRYLCEYCKSEYGIGYFSSSNDTKFILPFKINKKTAIKIYYKNMKSRLLTYRAFKKRKSINQIEGVYVPCYLYDLNSIGEIKLTGDKTSSWKSGKTNYKKVDTYEIVCSGEMVSKDLLVPLTQKLKDEMFYKIESYSFKEKVAYKEDYLKGYSIYNLDKSKEKFIETINNKLKSDYAETLIGQIKEYENIKAVDSHININKSNHIFILIPIWSLTLTYEGKKNVFLINGQNGKFVGDIPFNKNGFMFMWLIIFVIVFVILLVLTMVIL